VRRIVTRTIPTCVGKTGQGTWKVTLPTDHPHVCGENRKRLRVVPGQDGPSPRVWGKQAVKNLAADGRRTIPTCVGKTPNALKTCPDCTDHPHVCGENMPGCFLCQTPAGPSPRVWGKQDGVMATETLPRTIPTCVGKTIFSRVLNSLNSDHPHVCGENPLLFPAIREVIGPSPRVWGKHLCPLRLCGEYRTIPTCVGKTSKKQTEFSEITDHPHVCGEN